MAVYHIFGSIRNNEPNEGNPLTVGSEESGADVVVGSRTKDFIATNAGTNLFTFQLAGSNPALFIGVGVDGSDTKILKLTLEEVIWEVSHHQDLTAFEVSGVGANVGLCWDLHNTSAGSTIKLLSRESTSSTTRKQKWKFVRVKTI